MNIPNFASRKTALREESSGGVCSPRRDPAAQHSSRDNRSIFPAFLEIFMSPC
jgi:hypothetical protein